VIDANTLGEQVAAFNAHLEEHFEAAKTYKPNEADWFGGRWSGFNQPPTPKPRAATCPPASSRSCSTALAAR
jgi:2-oxoglutarate dehydrogenase E1 component